MQPIRSLLRTLDEQFIKFLHGIIRIIQQDHRITRLFTSGLLNPLLITIGTFPFP